MHLWCSIKKIFSFDFQPKGIEIVPDKVKAIQEMPAPRTEKQVRGFESIKEYLLESIKE